ncbi:MAG: hypothetical protein NVS3B23_01920 [Candidatus Saccharimonadales bacterium]
MGIKYIDKNYDTRYVTNVQYNSEKKSDKQETVEGSLYKSTISETNGRVQSIFIPGTKSGFKARKSYVYSPAIANNKSGINLPVIILTAGYPGITENWLDGGKVETTMNSFASKHHGITPLVFMVDNTGSVANDTECVDSSRGNVETYLTQDVPNFIKNNYEVSVNPDNWAVGGLSLGGMCSIMLTLRHTDTFHTFLDLGGEIGPEIGSKQKTIQTLFNGSEQNWLEHQPLNLLQKNKYPMINGYFAASKNDSFRVTQSTRSLYMQSKVAGIDSIFETVGGEHTFKVWEDTYRDGLPWIANKIGATDCPTNCF